MTFGEEALEPVQEESLEIFRLVALVFLIEVFVCKELA
jgi:hypothetical protein